MHEEIIKIFEVNTDAIATNRGFYYQYLKILKKWINNYVQGIQLVTYNEVEDDIKEVGDQLIFTQTKCYSSTLSLNSVEVKKSLFNFFILFVKYQDYKNDLIFCFSTNTEVSKKEKLLLKWISDKDYTDKDAIGLYTKKTREILLKEINKRKNKLLQRKTKDEEKNYIKNASHSLKEILNDNNIIDFVKCITWEFEKTDPESAIKLLTSEIVNLLKHEKFRSHSPKLLFSCFLSEIYKNSQNTEISERALDSNLIVTIINKTEKELEQSINKKLTILLKSDIQLLKADIASLRINIDQNMKDIDSIKKGIVSDKKLPRNLNLLPDYQSLDIYGWDTFLDEVKSILDKKRLLSIHAEGGMGKTAFGKKFLQKFDDYDHIIWINAETSISSAFLLDDTLNENLEITNLVSKETSNIVYENIINALNKIEGNNLIIVDVQESKNEIAELKSISLSSNWHKLILTRSRLTTFPNKKLPKLTFEEAKNIYASFSFTEDINDIILNAFFDLVEYNILVIELVAKTIQNSLDLSLDKFIDSFKNQNLDENEFQIDIEIDEKSESIRIFNYLLEKYSFPNLKVEEKNFLDYLSILPSNSMTIDIEELISINGTKFYNNNKTYIINILNSLSKKGLINISEDRKQIRIHRIIQQILIYKQRSTKKPFFSNLFFISWLTRRIKESNNTPEKSLKYLKYADSILNCIKEEHRGAMYENLLLLENEYFYTIRFYFGAKNELSRLIDLSSRAEKFLLNNNNNVLLGIIYNNLALCYSDNENLESAKVYFNKAITCFNGIEKKEILILKITAHNNLTAVFLKEDDVTNAFKIFDKTQKLRKKYYLFDDIQISIEFRLFSQAYRITNDVEKAIINIMRAIKWHLSFKETDRNDFYLAMYFNELAFLYLEKDEIEKAIDFQEKCVNILEVMNFNNSKYLLDMYLTLNGFYKFYKDFNKSKIIEQKINSFTGLNSI